MSREKKEKKSRFKKYKEDIDYSYYLGYKRGFEDSLGYPKVKGSATAGSAGYRDGVKDRREQEKFNAKLAKSYRR